MLHADGVRVLAVASAEDGFEALALEDVGVVVSDQRMPGMSGTEFLSRVRDLYPHTVRIMLSGYAELSSVTDAVNRGAVRKYFTKPWDDGALREAILEALRVQPQTQTPSG